MSKLFKRTLCAFLLSLSLAVTVQAGEDNLWERVIPWFTGTGIHGSFASSVAQIQIRYAAFTPKSPRGIIVFLTGRSETILKYAELAQDLYQQGYSVYMMDHRGQGLSDRLLKDHQKGYVENFEDYVQDLRSFMKHIVLPAAARKKLPIFALTHSMGGAVMARYLEEDQPPIQAAVLSSPMMGISVALAKLVVATMTTFGGGDNYAIGYGPYDPTEEKNKHTHSVERLAFTRQIAQKFPRTVLGGPTNRWVLESFRGTAAAQKDAAKISIPLMVFQSGEEQIVRNNAQKKFCERTPHCQLKSFPGAFHELLMETDDLRGQALKEILSFFQANTLVARH